MHKSTVWQTFSLTHSSCDFHSDTSDIIQSNAKDNPPLNHDSGGFMMTLQMIKKKIKTLQEQFIHSSNVSDNNSNECPLPSVRALCMPFFIHKTDFQVVILTLYYKRQN